MANCDVQLIGASELAIFTVEIDGTNSIEETTEGNNVRSEEFQVRDHGTGSDNGNSFSAVVALSIVAVMFSLQIE